MNQTEEKKTVWDDSLPTAEECPKDNKTDRVKILLFGSFMLIAFVIGLLVFLRPTVSETEKRELAKFPDFSVDAFLSGEYFSDVTAWYADTYPGREGLIGFNQAIRSLFGIRTVQIIPSNPGVTPSPSNPSSGTNGPLDNTPIEKLGSVYVKGNTAYELYGENRANSERYAALIAKAAAQLEGVSTVYGMVVPLSSSVNLSEKELDRVNASDAADAIARMYAGMSGVKTVNIYDTLRAHNSEYLYFRTDHHWTALGAYYTYTEFCGAAGLAPIPLDARQKHEFEGFLGTLYADAGNPPKLAQTPDVVEAWVPNGTNDIYITDRNGVRSRYRGGVVRTDTDSFYQNAASKYNCFIMGDNPLSEIHNESITDGSSIIVVKESFGNALVPFLVDHYEYVYVVDYRYFTSVTHKTLAEFAKEKSCPTVLFINNLTATSATPRLNELEMLLAEP